MSVLSKITSFITPQSSNHKDLYEQFNSNTEVERARHFQKQFDYYIGDTDQIKKHLVKALIRTFSQDDINEFQLPLILIVKRVIDKISMAYLFPADRYLQVDKEEIEKDGKTVTQKNEGQVKQAELYSEVIGNSNINQKVKLCYRFAKLSDVCHIQVVWRNERIEYDVIPSHLITVLESKDDFTRPIATLVQIIKADDNGDDQVNYLYWDENESVLMDGKGRTIKVEPNPYKVLTTLPMRIRETENYFGEGDSSLIDINEKINVALVNAFDNMVMQSHGQAFGINLGIAAGTLKTGPRHIIEVNNVKVDDQSPAFTFVQPDPSTKEAMEFIDWLIKEVCVQRGLPPFSVSTEGKAESGAAKVMDNLELMEIRQDDIEALKEFEHKLYEITRAVWNFHNPGKKLDEKMRFAVEFEEQSNEPPELEQLHAKRLKLQMGTWTPVEEFVDPDNGVDEEAALNIVKKNLAIRNELNDEFGIMQALDKALQTDENFNKGMIQ